MRRDRQLFWYRQRVWKGVWERVMQGKRPRWPRPGWVRVFVITENVRKWRLRWEVGVRCRCYKSQDNDETQTTHTESGNYFDVRWRSLCSYTGGVMFMTPFTRLSFQWTDNFVRNRWMRGSRRTSGPWWRIFFRLLGVRISSRWRYSTSCLWMLWPQCMCVSISVCVSITMGVNIIVLMTRCCWCHHIQFFGTE